MIASVTMYGTRDGNDCASRGAHVIGLYAARTRQYAEDRGFTGIFLRYDNNWKTRKMKPNRNKNNKTTTR